MCIAIVKTKDGNITDRQLRNCFDSNPDGAGIAYSSNGVLWIVKGIFTADELVEQYHKAEELADGAMLVHCRISTSGKVDRTNCHPHVVHSNCVMIHNGVLKIDVPKDSKVSDTVLFVEQLLKPLPPNFMLDDGIMNMITHIIGAGNKFCFLNEKGEYAIANETAGHWKDGVWFSNYSYADWGYSYGKNWKKTKYGYTNSLKAYGGYDDYYYGEYDDEYYQLTDKETYELERVIGKLTTEQFVKLGLDPIYDFWSNSLVRANEQLEDTEGRKHLSELNSQLDILYEENYYIAIDEILNEYINEVKDEAFDPTLLDHLEDYERYILTQYSVGTSSEEEKAFDEENTKFTVRLDDVDIEDDDLDEDDTLTVGDVKELAETLTDDNDDVIDVEVYDANGNLIDNKEFYEDDSYNRYENENEMTSPF